jgi:hypothetical protein
MTPRAFRLLRLAATLLAAPWAPTSALAATVSGGAAFAGQRTATTHGLAWWKADTNELRLALFERPPPEGMLAELRAGEWGEGGPVMTIHLRLDPGLPGGPAAVTYCYLDATFPRGGVMGTNTNAEGCGLALLEGDLRPGGHVVAALKGEAVGPGDQPYAWEVRLDLPIAK